MAICMVDRNSAVAWGLTGTWCIVLCVVMTCGSRGGVVYVRI